MSTILDSLKRYCQNNTEEQIREAWDAFEEYDKIGPNVDDFMAESKLLFYEQTKIDNYWEFFCSNQLITNPKFSSDFLLNLGYKSIRQ